MQDSLLTDPEQTGRAQLHRNGYQWYECSSTGHTCLHDSSADPSCPFMSVQHVRVFECLQGTQAAAQLHDHHPDKHALSVGDVDGDRLDMLEQTLQWRHMAPTAPDTLTCYPFATKDPMVISECPHIYFAGGQPEFATRLLEG